LHRKTASDRINDESVPLVRKAILGDNDAIGELCLLYRPVFLGYIHHILSKKRLPPSLGDDLLQDTYEKVCKSFPYYDPSVGNMGAYMQTVVERVCSSYFQLKENRRREIPMSNINGDEGSDDSDWTVTDGMVAAEWTAENSPGYVGSLPPLQNPQGSGGGRPRLNKAKAKKLRARRLPPEEIERREKVRQEWAAEESQSAR
jgi:DNA-directed RNA polymerase specialized sigma24 family protein